MPCDRHNCMPHGDPLPEGMQAATCFESRDDCLLCGPSASQQAARPLACMFAQGWQPLHCRSAAHPRDPLLQAAGATCTHSQYQPLPFRQAAVYRCSAWGVEPHGSQRNANCYAAQVLDTKEALRKRPVASLPARVRGHIHHGTAGGITAQTRSCWHIVLGCRLRLPQPHLMSFRPPRHAQPPTAAAACLFTISLTPTPQRERGRAQL
jgi:hypothetical protein